MKTIRAAAHELRCAQCRVTWWSWLLRLMHLGGMTPAASDLLRRGTPTDESFAMWAKAEPRGGWGQSG